ncbi:hypothetical protein [Marinobacterium lacunae]|nr:hypothetical protein [Marinobacterium lacunae]
MTKSKPSKNSVLHHLGVAVGLTGLGAWFMAGRELGFLDWATRVAPDGYSGASLMLAIMVMMAPAFGIWTLFNRWLERRLDIKGRYMEDEYYRSDEASPPRDGR